MNSRTMRGSGCVGGHDAALRMQSRIRRVWSGSLELKDSGGYVCQSRSRVSQVIIDGHGCVNWVRPQGETNFSHASPQEAPHEIFPPLKFSLDNNKAKICLWVHIPRHVLDRLNLLLDPFIDPLNQAICRPSTQDQQTAQTRDMHRKETKFKSSSKRTLKPLVQTSRRPTHA